MTEPLPDLAGLKAQARRLRLKMARSGSDLKHAAALELIALHYGYKDWNTLYAVVREQTDAPVETGDRIRGTYLSHRIQGEVAAASVERLGWFRVRLKLDEAVDVVASRHFSGWRRQVTAVIDASGETAETTSDGEPVLRLDMDDLSR